jgi:glutaredoxin-like protein NrdH
MSMPRARVTVYSTGPAGQRCRLTCEHLTRAGVEFRLIDLTGEGSDDVRAILSDDLGYTEAPVVLVDDEPEHHWSGFRPDLIDRLAAHIHGGAVRA